mmetsp:Transcript_52705/g.140577  ORF Transcript_52705/g.140577 Transcript_52705/m.140577 type:complete len:588 (-) Transcript_52705:96-1859(-)
MRSGAPAFVPGSFTISDGHDYMSETAACSSTPRYSETNCGPPAYNQRTAQATRAFAKCAGKQWWHSLYGESCPISLTPLDELDYAPFGLGVCASDAHGGVWDASMWEEHQLKVIHWFDGAFLASFLVSSGQFMDPVNRRPLHREECLSLDKYLAWYELPSVYVADAFDLSQNITGTGCGNSRIVALEREAATLLHSLFSFRSTSRDHTSQPGPRTGISRGSEASAPSWLSRSVPTVTVDQSSRTQRTVHRAGGLTVIDDDEYDEVAHEDAGVDTKGSDPTPAEALSVSRPRAPLRAPGQRGRRRWGEGASVSFALTGGRPARTELEVAARSTVVHTDVKDETPATVRIVGAWTPEWAQCELHERTLEELQVVEAVWIDNCRILNPEARQCLVDCVANRTVSTNTEPLIVEVQHSISSSSGDVHFLVDFSLPQFYPTHCATVSIREVEPTGRHAAVEYLERSLRELVNDLEGTEVILAALDWIGQHGPSTLAACVSVEVQATVAHAEVAVETKEERIQKARMDRMGSKYTGTWDVCYAFAKHGHCKDKNCLWKHSCGEKATPQLSTATSSAAPEKNAKGAKRKTPKNM